MKTFVVIGLGRFGSAVATELSSLGHEVLAVDEREDHVQRVAEKVTHAVTGDARDPSVLRALGVRNYDCAVVAVGDDIGNSALITLNLKEIGVKRVICKAQSHVHRKVLEKIGADRVVFDGLDLTIRKGDKELRALIDEGFRKLQADPYWKELQAKYLSK